MEKDKRNIIELSIEIDQYQFLQSLLEIDTEKQIFSKALRQRVLKYLLSVDYFDDYIVGNSICSRDEDTLTNNIIKNIIKQQKDFTIEKISELMPQKLSSFCNALLTEKKIDSLLSKTTANIDNEFIDKLYRTLLYINTLSINLGTEMNAELIAFVNTGYAVIKSFILGLLQKPNNDSIVGILGLLLDMIILADIDKEEYSRSYTILSTMGSNGKEHNISVMLLDRIEDKKYKAGWIIVILALKKFDEEACEILFENIKSNSKLLEYCTEIVRCVSLKTDISISIDGIGNINIIYNNLKAYFLNNCWKLPKNLFISFLQALDIDTILKLSELLPHTKEFNIEEKICLITKVENFRQCKELYNFIPHNSFKKEYHEKVKSFIEVADSVSELERIHSCEQTDSTELRWIKEKILEKFPDTDKTPFSKIVWKEDEM